MICRLNFTREHTIFWGDDVMAFSVENVKFCFVRSERKDIHVWIFTLSNELMPDMVFLSFIFFQTIFRFQTMLGPSSPERKLSNLPWEL
jgi:hypothetical protein